jgi:2-polyprenyl-3-methyl-5-hydroxy-6-metoxy-1,4-benzoquinol methylase
MSKDSLSIEKSHQYWVKRHQENAGDWKAVGFKGGASAVNKAFYDCRFKALKGVLSRRHIDLSDKRVLDVGCGLGDFSRYYSTCGAKVSGIDISPDAVKFCKAQDIGDFEEGGVSAVSEKFQHPFDLIHCFDVLYHVTAHEEWQAALSSFAQISCQNTTWLFTEIRVNSIGTATASAEHVKKRTIEQYQTELALHNRQIVEEIPLYWLFSAFPWLAQRFPRMIPHTEWLGRFIASRMNQRVVMWVVREKS